jgi:hypothetical protein
MGVSAVVAGSLVSGYVASKSASKAASAQTKAAQMGVDEQGRQFDSIVQMMQPYLTAGNQALGGYSPYQQAGQSALGGLQRIAGVTAPAMNAQMALSGLSGGKAQQQYINQIQNSPEMQAYLQQGQNAMLQNASATGGLRGGNTQAAMAELAPNILNSLINQKYNQFSGLSNIGGQALQNLASGGQTATMDLARLGQASAGGQASLGQASAVNIGNLLQQQGAAQAGGIMGQSNAITGTINSLVGAYGSYNAQKTF